MSNMFPHNDFDRHFQRNERFVKRGIGAFFGAWLIYSLFSLGVVIALICVAVHFISKFW